MSKRYIISDLHLGHSTLARLRGFRSVEEHDAAIMQNWASTVQKHDIVFVLGDVTLHKASHLSKLGWENLPGRKVLVMGNHDDSNIAPYFDSVVGVNEIKVMVGVDESVRCVMTHIPMHHEEVVRWDYNLHGHLHTNIVYYAGDKYINVCAETLNLRPQLVSDVVQNHMIRMKTQ